MSASATAEGLSAKEMSAATPWWRLRPQISGENLVLLSALYFSLFSNGAFWRAAIDHPLAQWRFVLSLFLVVTALHALLLGLVANHRILKPLLTVMLLVTAIALLLMPNASTLWMAIGALWLLTASINIAMDPSRALVADNLPQAQRARGYAIQVFFIGAGAVFASALILR